MWCPLSRKYFDDSKWVVWVVAQQVGLAARCGSWLASSRVGARETGQGWEKGWRSIKRALELVVEGKEGRRQGNGLVVHSGAIRQVKCLDIEVADWRDGPHGA